jgi:hypothetical protein
MAQQKREAAPRCPTKLETSRLPTFFDSVRKASGSSLKVRMSVRNECMRWNCYDTYIDTIRVP